MAHLDCDVPQDVSGMIFQIKISILVKIRGQLKVKFGKKCIKSNSIFFNLKKVMFFPETNIFHFIINAFISR